MLSRAEILAANDRRIEPLEVPEWGGTIFVRSLTGTERDSYEAGLHDGKGKVSLENARARLAALTVCDDKGALLFSRADLAALGGKSAKALDRIFDKALALSGMAKGDVEAAAKNSESGQSGDSTSDSLSPSAAPSANSSSESAPKS